MTSRFLVLAFLVVSAPARAQEKASPTAACSLPRALSDAVFQRFASSRVLKASDLYDDERSLFSAEHPGACPGVVQGHFFGATQRPAMAFVLLDAEGDKRIRLVVARPALKAWILHEVDELAPGSTPVVTKKAPGTYADPRDAKARTAGGDAVVLIGLESWQRIYVWNGRKFDAVKAPE